MVTRSWPGARLVTATLLAVSALVTLVASAAAETTHEANLAAAESTVAPSTLTAETALARMTDAPGTLHFEIAEDATRFVWADHALFGDRRAAYGAPFLTQGYIYPPGTLSATADGVNPDGSPQFPEQVIGAWTCYGWYVGEGFPQSRRSWILATEIYQFGSAWGAVTLVSEGYVSTDGGTSLARAITGGTGPFVAMRGEVQSTPLGVNDSQGENARYEVQLQAP